MVFLFQLGKMHAPCCSFDIQKKLAGLIIRDNAVLKFDTKTNSDSGHIADSDK